MSHIALSIGIGIPFPPGYSNNSTASNGFEYPTLSTPESTPQVIDLLSGQNGLQLQSNNDGTEWWPSRPDLKGGGQWRDPAAQDGRQLSVVSYSNVIETIELKVSADTKTELFRRVTLLQRFVNLAQDYSAEDFQVQPVWIKWHAEGGAGPQYSRVENMSLSVSELSDAQPKTQNVTLVLEREPEWYPVRPGESPLEWGQIAQGKSPGSGYDFNDLNWNNVTNFLVSNVTLTNTKEWADSGVGVPDYEKTRGNMSITIPGEDIPGDAPARIGINLIADPTILPINWYVARDTRALETLPDYDRFLTINGCDNDQDLFAVDAEGTFKYNTAGPTRFTAPMTAVNNTITFDGIRTAYFTHMFRGRHMVFVRGYQVGGNAGDVTLTLTLGQNGAGTADLSNRAEWDVTNPTFPALTYMDEIRLPFVEREPILQDGKGINARTSDGFLTVQLNATFSGAAVQYNVFDIVCIPIDEYASTLLNRPFFIDNTGFFDRGQRRDYTRGQVFSGVTRVSEIRGQLPRLQPGVDNRLWFLGFDNNNVSRRTDATRVSVAILPAWYGVRDV